MTIESLIDFEVRLVGEETKKLKPGDYASISPGKWDEITYVFQRSGALIVKDEEFEMNGPGSVIFPKTLVAIRRSQEDAE